MFGGKKDIRKNLYFLARNSVKIANRNFKLFLEGDKNAKVTIRVSFEHKGLDVTLEADFGGCNFSIHYEDKPVLFYILFYDGDELLKINDELAKEYHREMLEAIEKTKTILLFDTL